MGSYAARQPPALEAEKPVYVLVTGFGVSILSYSIVPLRLVFCCVFSVIVIQAIFLFSHDDARFNSRKIAAEIPRT